MSRVDLKNIQYSYIIEVDLKNNRYSYIDNVMAQH